MMRILAFLTGGWIGPAVIAGLLAAAGAWVWYEVISYGDRRAAEVQADWDADVIERRLAYVGQMEVERVKGAQHAIDLVKERERRKRDAVVIDTVRAAAAGTFNGLRDTSSAVTAHLVQACPASATGPGIDGPAEATGGVFAECSRRRETVAGDAEELAETVRGLQAYASSALMVCGREPERPVVAEH